MFRIRGFGLLFRVLLAHNSNMSSSSNQLPLPTHLSFASALASGQSITAPIAVKGRLSYELDKQIYPLSQPKVVYSITSEIKQNKTVVIPITRSLV